MPIDETLETWATVDDVLELTDQTVTEGRLRQAQDIVELFAGPTFGATDNISERNLRLLNRAVAYQAGWMNHRPDLFTHMETDSSNQSGTSFTKGHENAELLAPMVIRLLRRLSWAQKPLHVRRGYGSDDYSDEGSRDSAVADDNRAWMPL